MSENNVVWPTTEQFIAVWQAASSLNEVISVLFPEANTEQLVKTRKQYCSQVATTLRKTSNPELKKFPRGRVKKVEETFLERQVAE